MWLFDRLSGKQPAKPTVEAENSEFIQYEYVMTFRNQINLALVKSVLESEKINYFIKGEFDLKSSKELLVDKEKKQEVLDILKAFNINADGTAD